MNFPLCGNDSERRGNDALRAHIGSSGHARPPPPGCGRSPPYLLLVTGVRLAHPGSFLAEATFAPAQPPFMVTELLGDKSDTEETVLKDRKFISPTN